MLLAALAMLYLLFLLRSFSICPVCPVRPVTSLIEGANSQSWFQPKWPCLWIRAAQFSSSGLLKRGNWVCYGGQNELARLGSFHLIKRARTGSFRPERPDECNATKLSVIRRIGALRGAEMNSIYHCLALCTLTGV